jgi:uncharacterized protein YidB (DUF937 family)
MGFFDNALGNAAPQGGLTKPLIIAAGALLLAKYLHGGSTPADTPDAVPVPAPAAPPVDTSDAGGGLLGGLGGLLQKFQQAGQGDVANSWVGTGQNQPIEPGTLGNVLGSQTIKDLAQKAGINEGDLLSQLAQNLPNIINALTPKGRLPTQSEIGQ